MSEKLQKVLARIGVGSRRDMEEYISAGRVSVNGKVATLGDRVEDDAVIRVDGQVIKNATTEKPICRVLMYNKPEGQMCTANDPQGRPTVFDRLPTIKNSRWLYIGRLDINTSGLLLFTTDGELANSLMHPRNEIERVYAVRVFGEVTKEHIMQLQNGVELEDGMAHFDKVIYVGGEGINQWYNVILKEGRKREVRRLWEALGLQVSRLKRISYANIELGKLPQGGWEELPLEKVNALRALVGLKPETQSVLKKSTEKLDVRKEFLKRKKVTHAVERYNSRIGSSNRKSNNFERNYGERSVNNFKKDGSFVNQSSFLAEEQSFASSNGLKTSFGEKSWNRESSRKDSRNSKRNNFASRDDFKGYSENRGRQGKGSKFDDNRFSVGSQKASFRKKRDDEGFFKATEKSNSERKSFSYAKGASFKSDDRKVTRNDSRSFGHHNSNDFRKDNRKSKDFGTRSFGKNFEGKSRNKRSFGRD